MTGITPVDISGLLGIVDQNHTRRLQEMVLGKQIAKLEADAVSEAGFRGAVETAFPRSNPWGRPTITRGSQMPGFDPAAPSTPGVVDAGTPDASASTGGPANLLPDMYFGAPRTAAAAPPTSSKSVPAVNWDGITEMLHYKPKETLDILKNLGEMSDTEIKRADARAGALGVASRAIMGVSADDPSARAVELEKWAPYLRERGITDEQIASADLSDAGLSRQFAKAFDFKAMVDKEKGDRDFAATQADRTADNARADATLNETRAYHSQTLGQGAARIGIARQNAGEISPSKVMGPILNKIATGGMKALTPAEAEAFNAYKSIGIVDQAMGRGAPVPDVAGEDDGSTPLSAAPARTNFAPPPKVGSSNSPAAAPRIAVGQTATNPRTGAKVRWDGKSWQPVR